MNLYHQGYNQNQIRIWVDWYTHRTRQIFGAHGSGMAEGTSYSVMLGAAITLDDDPWPQQKGLVVAFGHKGARKIGGVRSLQKRDVDVDV